MKTAVMLTVLLTLAACGKKSGSSSSSKSTCSPTKQAMSTWTSRDTGTVFMMAGCSLGSICEVKYGGGTCSDARGDFLIIVRANGTATMGDCSGNITEQATYSIGCDNLLSLTYSSDGVTEIFE